jgi:hypothetical protein
MNRKPYLDWFTGVAAVLVIVVALWMVVASFGFEPVGTEGLPGGFGGRVIALEFVSVSWRCSKGAWTRRRYEHRRYEKSNIDRLCLDSMLRRVILS